MEETGDVLKKAGGNMSKDRSHKNELFIEAMLEYETFNDTKTLFTNNPKCRLAIISYIKARINCLVSHVLFDYKGVPCGVDPFSHHCFDVWYGDKAETMTSIDDVMNKPFFDGKSLTEIVPEMENVEL